MPAKQLLQSEDAIAPVEDTYLPAAQLEQAAAPPVAKVPARQLEQTLAPKDE